MDADGRGLVRDLDDRDADALPRHGAVALHRRLRRARRPGLVVQGPPRADRREAPAPTRWTESGDRVLVLSGLVAGVPGAPARRHLRPPRRLAGRADRRPRAAARLERRLRLPRLRAEDRRRPDGVRRPGRRHGAPGRDRGGQRGRQARLVVVDRRPRLHVGVGPLGEDDPVDAGGALGRRPGYDFFHANAVSLGKSTVLLSLRQTDGVYAIDRATGQIVWKLGGTPTPESLTVVGDPGNAADPLGGQHDARLLPDGTLTVFDDGTLLGRAPRALHFRIDPVARTATLIGEVSDPTVPSSFCCGSARLLANGNWLVSWGGDPVVGEYRPDGTPVWRLSFDGLFSYRIVPVALGELSVADLRAGMDAMASC
ncbi:MAG TPA: arylsulfotransferase family protein [Gaiellaceae bacterium]|nr:arylsulfotransferase family protein [Gaiellaceae bacterium]